MRIYMGTKPGNVKDFAGQDAMGRLSLAGGPKCVPVGSIVPEQPWELDQTTQGAEFRAEETERLVCVGRKPEADEVFLGCENGICTTRQHAEPEKCIFTDPAVLVARTAHGLFYATSWGIQAPTWAVLEAKEIIRKGLAGEPGGDKDITVGKVIARRYKERGIDVDHANWHKFLTNGKYDRRVILADAIFGLLSQIPGIG